MGSQIAKNWFTWNMLRSTWLSETTELRKYLYAVDTTKTTNGKLPWKNKTTIPKICQIRDNLFANYMASLFPKRKWLRWEAYDRDSNTQAKKAVITGGMSYALDQRQFKLEVGKIIQDYIDYGNAFAMPVWEDKRVQVKSNSITQAGYVGPGIRRISPLDICMNPIADNFETSPVIVRSLVTMGEIKEMLQRLSGDDTQKWQALLDYMVGYRMHLLGFGGELAVKDEYLNVDGFTNYRLYLDSNYTEVLTFYGDIYDPDTKKFLKNQIVTVVDRHRVVDIRPNPSLLGRKPIYHIGWRTRQDNLWGMSPLANLVGMQYRLDHIENLKADVWDLTAFPPLKIKGYVQDFEWGPFARIYVDEDGDVEMLKPEWNVLMANSELQAIMVLMEEMAGAPREAMGFRTPGEKTKYEVQRTENAAARIFQSKVSHIEENFFEPLYNGMLEMWQRLATSDILAKYFDDDAKVTRFLELTPDDLSGEGRIVPFAARHFAEQAELVQNLTNFFASPIGGDPGIKAHFSTIKLARLFEDVFDIHDWQVVMPYVRMAEEADAQRIAQAQQEAILMEALTPSGLTPDDTAQPHTTPGAQGAMPGVSPGQTPSPLDQPPNTQQLAAGPLGPDLTHSIRSRTGATTPMPGATDQAAPTPAFQNSVGFPPGNGQ